MLEYAATALVTFFVIIDPVGVLPIFMMLTRDQENKARRQTAIKSILVASVILIVFAGAGEFFLRLLGITLPAFRIAGGILLLLLSIDMVFARQSGIRTTTDVVEATEVFVDHRLLLNGPMGAGSAGRHPSIKIMAISAEAKDRPLKSSAVPPPDNHFWTASGSLVASTRQGH